MNTKILGLRTAIYQVGDIAAARKWYAEAFETDPYFDQPFYVGFDIGGFELGLQPEEKKSADKPESVVAYWGVEDIQAHYDRLLALGAREDVPPVDVGGGIMTAKLKDPWGNIIGIIHNPHFKLA